MPRAEWYIVQVHTGSERRLCARIERACREAEDLRELERGTILSECFSPLFRTQRKVRGAWEWADRPLLPGYLVAVSVDPAGLAQVLRGVLEPCRLLVTGGEYVPLRREERLWIEETTRAGERVVPMSFGYREGDAIVITSGPLKGREGLVTRVNRAKSLAHVEFHAGPLTIKTTVGLALLSAVQARAEARAEGVDLPATN